MPCTVQRLFKVKMCQIFHVHPVYPLQISKLQKIMTEDDGSHFEFVKSVRTRRFSHCSMFFLYSKQENASKSIKITYVMMQNVMNTMVCNLLGTIGSKRFKSKLGLISEVLHIVRIEISNIEIELELNRTLFNHSKQFRHLFKTLTCMMPIDSAFKLGF